MAWLEGRRLIIVWILGVLGVLWAPCCLGGGQVTLSQTILYSSIEAQPDAHADTQQQQSTPLLTGRGGRKLQQDVSPLPSSVPSLPASPINTTANTASVAPPQNATTPTPLAAPAALPASDLAPIQAPPLTQVSNSTTAAPPVAAVPIEQAWPAEAPDSFFVPQDSAGATDAPVSAEPRAFGVVHHDVGDDATAVDEVEAPVSAVSDGFEEDADAPSPLEEPPPPATLIDSVIADQIHQGHLRISVVVIIAGLMGICGFGACVLFVTKRWNAEPVEDDYPLSPRGDYFILKSRPGKQSVLISHWNTVPSKHIDSMHGTIKSTLKQSMNNALSIPTSSVGGCSMPRATNWSTGGIPATPGCGHTLPSAGDAMYSSGGYGWGLSSGGRELGRDLYHSTGASERGEDDANANTWPPAMSRMNRILSVLPEGAEEDERLMSTFSRSSRLGPYSSFRMSAAPQSIVAAGAASGMPARRSSDPFSERLNPDGASTTPPHASRGSRVHSEFEGGPGLHLTCVLPGTSAGARAPGSAGQSGQGAAPALARICELGRMASSEMTVLVDTSMGGSVDKGASSVRYSGSQHQNQHSPANQGVDCEDKMAACVSQQGASSGPGHSDISRVAPNPDATKEQDPTSREGSWHSVHSPRSARSRGPSASGTHPGDHTPTMHASAVGANDVGLQLHVLSHQSSSSPKDPRQRMRSQRRLQLHTSEAAERSPQSDIAFDRLFSGPPPEMQAGCSRLQLENVSSLGAGSGMSAHGPVYQVHDASEVFSHPPEPSVEPSRMIAKRATGVKQSRPPHTNLPGAVSAAAATPHPPVPQRMAAVRNSSAPAAAGIHDTISQVQRERAPKKSVGLEGSSAAAAAAVPAGHTVDRTDSAGTQGSWEAKAIAKQAAAAWRSGRAQDGTSQIRNTSSTADPGGCSGGSAARRLVHDISSGSRMQSGRALRHSSSMAASVSIRNSLALRERRVVQASKDPLCFSRRPRRRSHVGNSHTASALRNVIATTAAAPEDASTHRNSMTPQNRSISPRFRNTMSAIPSDDIPTSTAVSRGLQAPFPTVPVSDYALTWLSKVRLSEGDAAAQPPPTQRTSDTVLVARGRDASSERDQDTPSASAFPSAGHSSVGHGSAADVNNQRRWGAAAASNTHVRDSQAAVFRSSHIPPHINMSTDAQMPRTASFGCQVGSHMTACEPSDQMRSVGVAVGRSVAGSMASVSVPSIPASRAAPFTIEPPSHPLRATLSSQSSLAPPPPPAPSNTSSMHALNAVAERTSADVAGVCSAVPTPTASESPTGVHANLRSSQHNTRASAASIHLTASGAVSLKQSTTFTSVRSDTFASESALQDDTDAARRTDSRIGDAVLCAGCSAGLQEAGLAVASFSTDHHSVFQHPDSGQSQCQNCGVAIDAEQLGDEAGVKGLQKNAEGSDMLPLLPTPRSQRGGSDSQSRNSWASAGSTKNVVQASIDSVRTSYGFVALGALAERCMRSSGGSLRGILKPNRSMQHQESRSSDGSIVSDLHTNAQRENLSGSMDCSVSIGNPNSSIATSRAARATAARAYVAHSGSPELPGAASVRSTVGSTSVTLALLPDTSPSTTVNGAPRDTADSAVAKQSVRKTISIELCDTGMLSHAAGAPTAALGPSWVHSRPGDADVGAAQDVVEVHRSTLCLSVDPISPCLSPGAHPQSAGATFKGPQKQRWRSTS